MQVLNNSALHGGGLFVSMQCRVQKSTINSDFFDNICLNGGGGGLRIGYFTKEVMRSSIHVDNCTFSNNNALYGGGTAIVGNQGSLDGNKLEFTNCLWTANTADQGRAITIAPLESFTRVNVGLIPSLVFTDCTFSMHRSSNSIERSRNIFFVTGYKLKFRGKTNFTENDATALVATNTELSFEADSEVKFIRNQEFMAGQ